MGPQLHVAHVVTTPTFAVTARDTLFQSPLINLVVHASYDATADGGLVWTRSVSANAPTIMVHDWKYELRRRMGGGG